MLLAPAPVSYLIVATDTTLELRVAAQPFVAQEGPLTLQALEARLTRMEANGWQCEQGFAS